MTQAKRKTLRLLADTLVPAIDVPDDPSGFFARKASDLGVDADVARIIESYLSPKQRADFHRFLVTLESPTTNLLLTGHRKRFSRMTAEERERYLLGWARSRIPLKRQGFQAIKRLVTFLAYAKVLADGRNPNWPALGYAAIEPFERTAHRHPPDLRIEPLRPTTELSIETDACIIGSGAGGSVIAAKLAEAGHRVVVLEAGPYRTADDFSLREADTYDTMFQGRGILTTKDLAFSVLAGQAAGGSATINWMTCLRPPPWAREEWELDHGMVGVASTAFDALVDEVCQRLHVGTAESVVNPSNEILRRGSEALGYRLGEDFDVIPRNAAGCDARCDFCFFGCIYNAKQSPILTYLPDAYRAGATFLFDTRADAILVDGGEARGVDAAYCRDGSEVSVRIRAKAVVAAGSAVQTPALFLRSGIRFAGVGRGLRLDPTTAVLGRFPDPIRMWSGPMQTIYVHRFQESDEGHHGPWLESAPGHPGLSALAFPWSGGRSHKEGMRQLERAASTIVLVRDVAEGRVSADARGRPILTYTLTPRDRRNLTRGLQEAARIHRAAGARQIVTLHAKECAVGNGSDPIQDAEFDSFLERIHRLGIQENGLALFSAHPMGSARGGLDPKRSTAKPTGECHEVRNLWIGDGGLLPTAPGVNPMISIMALAARTAGFIHDRLAHGRS